MEIRHYSSNNNKTFSQILYEIMKGFIEGRELASRLFIRDLKASFRKSFLGFFWMFIPPFATAGIWIFLSSQKAVSIQKTPMEYNAFVFCGTIIWSLFAEGISKPIQRYQSVMGMMSKLNFPREAVILTSFYDIIYSFILKLLVLIPILWFLGYPPGFNFLFAIPAILGMLFVSISLGLLLCPIGLLYNDIGRALPMLLPFLMYLSPVIYPIQENTEFPVLKYLNPATPFIENARSFMGGYDFNMYSELVFWLIISLISFIIGLIVMKISLPIIVERSGG